MKEIIIKNQQILEVLEKYKWFYNNKSDLDNIDPDCYKHKEERDYWISEKYLDIVKQMGSGHNGFPEQLLGYNLKSMDKKGTNQQLPISWIEKHAELNEQLMTLLSVRNNAVSTLYPPGGFISWHNNANATGFNIIFSWSETGDGWFDYIEDNGNGKRVRCEDKKGEWTCKYGMFGSYDQKEYPIVYHAASTNCWRMTVAFVFSKEEAAGDLQEFIIDELTTE